MRFSYCMVPEVYQLFWAGMARGEFGLPRVFRTVGFVLFHAAACSFKYSMRTWWGVR
jgi:hypothetical protein